MTNSYTHSWQIVQPVFHPFSPIMGQDNRGSLRDSKELQGEVSTSKNISELSYFWHIHSCWESLARNYTAKGEEGDQNQARHLALLQREGAKMPLSPSSPPRNHRALTPTPARPLVPSVPSPPPGPLGTSSPHPVRRRRREQGPGEAGGG